MNDPTLFQYCAKLIIFSADKTSVLLAKRKGEADYDGVFSFVGGKTETTDGSLLNGIKREKTEEIGAEAKVKICWTMSCYQAWFQKSNGMTMVLPHHVGIYEGGDIKLNSNEYAEYRWVPIAELSSLEPKVENVPEAVQAAQRLLAMLTHDDFTEV